MLEDELAKRDFNDAERARGRESAAQRDLHVAIGQLRVRDDRLAELSHVHQTLQQRHAEAQRKISTLEQYIHDLPTQQEHALRVQACERLDHQAQELVQRLHAAEDRAARWEHLGRQHEVTATQALKDKQVATEQLAHATHLQVRLSLASPFLLFSNPLIANSPGSCVKRWTKYK